YTDPFPTTTQVADNASTWVPSNTANTTTRDFHIIVWETGIIYATNYSSTAETWEIGYAAQCPSRYASDTTYNWICGVSNNQFASGGDILQQNGAPRPFGGTTANNTFWMRNVQGTIKSERGTLCVPLSKLGIVPGCPVIAGGYGNSVDRRKVTVHAIGSNTTTVGSSALIDRGAVPQMWTPLHSDFSGVGQADTITDGSSTFIFLRSNTSAGVLLQTSNDWDGYPGG
ncbi:MAG TPA: hypothetical protein VIY48_18725, partial [Candidatus Paceibacterota bacterium]